MEKEYGKLSSEQFARLISELPEVRKQQRDFTELVRAVPDERLAELLPAGFAWARIYELSYVEHLALLIFALDKVEFIQQAAKADDPQQMLLDDLASDEPDDWTGGWQGKFEKKHLIGLVTALQRSLLSVMLYQKTLSDLVEEVRRGSDDALFDAVRVDRSIVACQPCADRLAKAELLQEKRFFLRLRNALKGPSQKHWQSYQDLRYALYTLRQLGFDKLSDDQLEDLLVRQLKVYPNSYNARRNLRKHYSLSKKINNLK
jgi:hypothetical protein